MSPVNAEGSGPKTVGGPGVGLSACALLLHAHPCTAFPLAQPDEGLDV